jgi:hypothetical protein
VLISSEALPAWAETGELKDIGAKIKTKMVIIKIFSTSRIMGLL